MAGVARRFYALRAFDEGVLYFPLYALLFVDAGLSAGQVSSLFAIWSIVTFTLEIPSGAWADAFSRRWLLATGALMRASGFAIWTLWPSYAGFAIGFVLWGIRSATSSGTREALVYDELAALDATGAYVRVTGRAGTVALVTMGAATALAAPVFALGGYRLIGAFSVAACLGSAAAALSFPRTRRARQVDGSSGFGRYLRHLQGGLAEAGRRPPVRRLLVLAAAVPGVAAIDEYLPMLARELTAQTWAVPLLLLLPVAAMAVGSWLAPRWAGASAGRIGCGLGVAGGLIGLGALAHHPVGMLAVAGCMGLLQLTTVVIEARLQDTIRSGSRATVFSVSSLGAELFALAVFGAVGLGARWWGIPALVGALAVPVLATAFAARRWLTPLAIQTTSI